MIIRNNEDQKAWELGTVQFLLEEGQLHIIYKQSLNVSVPVEECVFHAGDYTDLLNAIKSLANEDEASVLTDFAAIAGAIRA